MEDRTGKAGCFCQMCGKGFTFINCNKCGKPQSSGGLVMFMNGAHTAEGERIRVANLTPEQRAQEGKQEWRDLGCSIIGIIVVCFFVFKSCERFG